jgi:hypothetical protein
MNVLQSTIVLLLIGFLSVVHINAQASEITADAYMENYIAALQKTSASPRRIQETAEYQSLNRSRWYETRTDEFDGQDNSRSKRIVKQGGKTTIYEDISIGDQSFCKVNTKPWIRDGEECLQGFNAVNRSGTATENYTKEDVLLGPRKATLYRAYIRTEDIEKNDPNKKTVSFSDNKLWISGDNLILRREYTVGILPNKLDTKIVETYEYNPRIVKIEAPIK